MFISTNQVKKPHTFRGGGGKNGNFNTIFEVLVFLKESLKCTKIYIVGSGKGFLSTTNSFYIENQCKKTCFKCSLFNIMTPQKVGKVEIVGLFS